MRDCARRRARRRPSRSIRERRTPARAQLNDSAETMSIKEVLGEHAKKIPVSGTKVVSPRIAGRDRCDRGRTLVALEPGSTMDPADDQLPKNPDRLAISTSCQNSRPRRRTRHSYYE